MAKTRYIITMADQGEPEEVRNTLSADSESVKDALVALESDNYSDESDVLAVEELGIYFKSMTDEDASALRKSKGVLAVEEDIEVFALGRCQGADELWQGDDNFDAGYQQALADMGMDTPDTEFFAGYDVADDCFDRTNALAAPTPQICPPGMRVASVPDRQRPLPRMRPGTRLRRQPIPWNISMVRADKAWARATGRGVKVAILDTGIADDHPDLIVQGGASFVSNVTSWYDDHGHGTHCAGIVAARHNATGVVGVAPDAELYAIKVLTKSGRGRMSWILAGMGWCLRNGIRVASMSLGSDVSNPDDDCKVSYQTAARRLENVGCIVVASAGNAGKKSNPWVGNPARCSGFMAVAAVDRNGRKADFSSAGPASLGALEGVEIAAPGVFIRSTVPHNGGYAKKSGTSMACPHVSGAAALIAQLHPTWSSARIRARLKETSQDLGAPGSDPDFGDGLLDCLAAIS